MTDQQPMFTGEEFNLAIDDVAEIREIEARNLAEDEAILADPNEDPRLIRFAKSNQEKTRQTVALFETQGDEGILAIAQNIFERGQALEASGAVVEDVISEVYKDIPEASLLYSLLRKRTWGYRLGQTMMALSAEGRVDL